MEIEKSLSVLAGAVESWLSMKVGRTPEKLGQLAGIADSTVRYILEGSRKPRASTVLALCSVVMTSEQKRAYLKEHYPKIWEQQEKMYQKDSPRADVYSLEAPEIFESELSNKLFNMAATTRGLGLHEIKESYGNAGLDAIESMLSSGVLVRDRDRVKHKSDDWTFVNPDDLLNQVSLSAKHFDKNLLGTDGASLAHLTGSLRKEDLPELKKMITKFLVQASDLKNTQEDGDCLFYIDLAYSLFNGEKFKK